MEKQELIAEAQLKDKICDYLETNLPKEGFKVSVGQASDDIYNLVKQDGYIKLPNKEEVGNFLLKWVSCLNPDL